MQIKPTQLLNTGKSSPEEIFIYKNEKSFENILLCKLAFCFELINGVVVVILLSFAWYYKDPQSLIIPSVMGFAGMPLIDISRRYFTRGLVHEGVIAVSIVSWLTALVIGLFASIVPVIFAISAVISFVPSIVAVPTVSSRLFLLIAWGSTLICSFCSLFVLMPNLLPEVVPGYVIVRLVAAMVPIVLCLLSFVLWFGHKRLQLSLVKAKHLNKVLAEQHRLERELEEQIYLEKKASLDAERASLEALRYQLNPHFLFNSLASIRGAIKEDTNVAYEMVSAFAEFCRITLTHGSYEVLSLKDDFEGVRLYLKMEQIRSGDDLDIKIVIPENLKEFVIPAFILQPLIENSIKYGRITSSEPLKIEVQVSPIQIAIVHPVKEKKKDYPCSGISIRVSNTGKWVGDENCSGGVTTGTGLKNLRQRLNKFYSENASIKYWEIGGWVHIEILLPYELS